MFLAFSVNLAQCSTKMGYYTKPIASIRHDSLGNPVDSQVHSWINMFYIPFTEENIRKVLKEFDYSYKGLALAVAVQGYAEKFYGSFKYSVYNIENFIQADFDDLLQASQKGFLKNKDPTYAGAVQDYVVDKEKKRELAQREYTDFKEKQKNKEQIIMSAAVRVTNDRPFKLRRLIEISTRSSLGIIIPSSFVDKMGLKAGEYMSGELNEEGTRISLNKCSLEMPGLTNAGEEED